MTTIFERLSKNFFGAIVAFIVSASVAFAADAKDYWVYFGTSTGDTTQEMKDKGIARSEGIYVGKYDASTGAISDIRLALKAPSSGYIATLPDRNLLYFIGCADPKDGWANAYACSVDPKTGSLTLINGNATTGQGVCHTTVRSDGKFLNVANYSSGDFSVLRLNEDGSVGEVTAKYYRDGSGPLERRQNHPYGHSSYFITIDGVCRVFMSDLGSDKVYIAKLDEKTGELIEDDSVPYLATPAGAGPRHLAFANDSQGRLFVFSINELDSTISAFRIDFKAGKSLYLGSWSTLEEELRDGLTDEETLVDGKTYLYGNKTAAIEVKTLENGKTLVYATNRGQNTIVVFDTTALLNGAEPVADKAPNFQLLQRISTNGNFPRYMTLDPTGEHIIVSNKKSGTIYVYAIDPEKGILTLTSDEPTKIAWVIAGGFIPMQ